MKEATRHYLVGSLLGLVLGFLIGALGMFAWFGYAMRVINARMLEDIAKVARVENEPQLQPPRFGSSFLSFELVLEDLQGNKVPMSVLKDKILVINFWSPSCKPCVAELPSLAALYRRYEKEPWIRILAISGDSREKLKEFLVRHPVELPVYRVEERNLSKLRPRVLPTTLIVDSDGKILVEETGGARWDHPTVFRFLEQLRDKGPTTDSKGS